LGFGLGEEFGFQSFDAFAEISIVELIHIPLIG
jgi:hypothetical protein